LAKHLIEILVVTGPGYRQSFSLPNVLLEGQWGAAVRLAAFDAARISCTTRPRLRADVPFAVQADRDVSGFHVATAVVAQMAICCFAD